jgi:hypothetical protein
MTPGGTLMGDGTALRGPGRISGLLQDPAVRRFLLLALLLGGCAFYGLVFSVNWKWGAALACFVVTLTFDFWDLRIAILPIFFAIAMDRLGKIGDTPLTVAKVLIAVYMIAWLTTLALERKPGPLNAVLLNPVFYLAGLLLALSLASVVNAHNIDMFLGQSLRRINNFVLFVILVSVVDSQKVVRWIFYIIIVAYFFVGLTAMYELMTGQSILLTVWGEEDTGLEFTLQSDSFRIGGPGGDPDFLAISIIFPSLVALRLLFDRSRFLVKAPAAFTLLMLTIAILATGSRGGLVSWLFALGLFWLFTEMRWKFLIASGAMVTVILLLAILSLTTSSGSSERFTGESGGTSVKYRLGWWKIAGMMIEDHPWIGVGTGNFPTAAGRYRPFVPQVPRTPYWTHNSLLQTWAENGVLAFVVYVGIYVVTALMMLRVIHRARDATLRRLGTTMLAAVGGYFMFAGSSNILENENYWIVFALCTVVYRFFLLDEAVRGASPAPAVT